MSFTGRVLFALLISLLLPRHARSQETGAAAASPAESIRTIQPTVDGLRLQLQEILGAAKDHNRSKVVSLVKQTEIPDYDQWFTRTFGTEKGESWSGPYGRDLEQNESDLAARFLEMGSQIGDVEVRKVNDAPRMNMESAMIGALQRPTEIFNADWRHSSAPGAFTSELIGYFVFVDGRFRWDSTIVSFKVRTLATKPGADSSDSTAGTVNGTTNNPTVLDSHKRPFRPGVGGVSYPACLYCPDPGYTKEGRKNQIEGTVILQVIIQPDGRATDILVVKGLEGGLTEKAVEAVRTWRFKPARGEGQEPVPVVVPIEVTFRILH